jgi:DMSO/TMAO reductase YedYZ molybdopterin-dependent catalytic subunit
VKRLLAVFAGLGCSLGPMLLPAKASSPAESKTVVPKETPMEELRGMNPADLDTSNLDLTPLEKFETMGLDDHDVEPDKWRLVVEGQVGQPLSLTYADLVALPPVERTVLMICPGFFANNGKWKGVSVRELMARAENKAEATHITFRGPHGSYEKVLRVPIADINSDKVFLAYEVNGQTLPKKHGFPLRLVAEGYYGYDWVKYVDKVVVETMKV